MTVTRRVSEWIANKLSIPEEEIDQQLKSGVGRFENQVAWARMYLVKAGYLDSSKRGVWTLTDKGRDTKLSDAAALAVFKEVHAKVVQERKERKAEVQALTEEAPEEEVASEGPSDHRSQLSAIFRDLPPAGFERLCQRLLRESGFEQVVVTGKSGDGGIDGHGVLQVNAFVSFKVLFQCKRYAGSVGAAVVRDFRGAMVGKADKGLILTTGTFTSEAKKEARRDGAPPIELINGETLIDEFERLELGLQPIKAFDVETGFFDEFRSG